MQRTAQFPDNAIDLNNMTIKKPYNYTDHEPQIFKAQAMIANIRINTLPGNQRARYTKIEDNYNVEEHDLETPIYKDPIKTKLVPSMYAKQVQLRSEFQPHYV